MEPDTLTEESCHQAEQQPQDIHDVWRHLWEGYWDPQLGWAFILSLGLLCMREAPEDISGKQCGLCLTKEDIDKKWN
jgi:hypothetical protein